MVFKVADTLRGCVGTGIDLTASTVTAGSSDNLLLSYSTDQQGLNYLPLPNQILTSGTYYIKAVNPAGCINILPVNVVIANPGLNVTNPAPVYYPVTIDLSATFTHGAGDTYSYYTNSDATVAISDYQHIAYSGTYYIKATNPTGCTTIQPVTVTVNPPPAPVINAVNTFTPNNDGVNDYFSISITGFGAFGSLSVYNRYGELVFETKSIDTRWDGKFNGIAAPVGTYYWLFTGNNTYDHSKISKSGFIALIR